MLESTTCFDKGESLSYKELNRKENSFGSVLEEITVCKKENSVLISDADGVWFKDFRDQLPVVSCLKKPGFREDIVDKLSYINEVFSEGNFFVATNRDPSVRFPWPSDKIINVLEESFQSVGIDSSFIFTTMNKQLPGVARGEIDRLTEEIVRFFYSNYSKDDLLQIISIEDSIIVHPFRQRFIQHIAKQVRKKIGKDIDIEILNFIV